MPSPETRQLPYVPIDCITSESIWLTTSKSGNEAKSSLVLFEENDILFGAMRPYFHKVCLAPFSGTTRTTAFVLQPIVESDVSFALLLLSEKSTIDFATQHSVGSTIPYAKWKGYLEAMPVVMPPKTVRNEMHAIVWPMIEQMKKAYFENRALSEVREALLPKLVSGELSVTELQEDANGD
jgi:type I restriction enzyme S subunit